MWLRQSTASQEVLLGRFLDSTDGNTEETGLTIANTDIKIWKEGATVQVNKNSGGATHDANGMYSAVLDATDSNTLGKIEVNVHVAGALSVRREFMVVPANVYDSLVLGTDTLTADLTQILGVAQSATDLKDFADAGYDPATNKVQGVVLVDTLTTYTGNTVQTGDSFARIGANGAGLTTRMAEASINTTGGSVDTVTTLTNKTGFSLSTAGILAIWNQLTSALTTASTIGKLLVDNINATISSRMAETSINTTGGAIDNVTLVATTTTNTDMRGTDGANTVVPDAAGVAPTAVENRQEMDSNSVQLNTTIPGLIDDLAIKKNTAFSNFEFLMVLTSDHVTPATGLTVTGQRSIDGGAFAAVSGTIAEVSNGIYQFDALAADTNGDVITWRFSSATADDTFMTFKTVA